MLHGRAGRADAGSRPWKSPAWFHGVFGDRYFIEIQNNGLEIQRLALERAVEIARRMGLPLVATSDAHYVNREDAEAQDVLLCINTGKFRTDKNRMRMEGDQFFLRSAGRNVRRLARLTRRPCAQSQAIADSVDIELELGKRHFPNFTPPAGKTPHDYLRELCLAGLERALCRRSRADWADGQLADAVIERLDRELAVINKLGFPNYFLDRLGFRALLRASSGIPATARGSGVGSLVCYALYLSHVCPLKYDLLFERFLDESRLEAPDIDIDFCKDRRGEVIQYVKDKYGAANVAQIGTFGTLAARAAIRDVGRALGMPIPRVDAVVALVPEELHITLKKALDAQRRAEEGLRQPIREVRELIDLAMKIEGLARNVGTHAAAVVIADRPLVEYVPLGTRGRQGRSHHPMGHGRRRGGRPAEDGLPGLAQPDDSVQGGRADRADDRRADRSLSSFRSTTRDVRPALPRRDQGHLPARKRRHSRPAAEDEARPFPRHHRHQRAVSARPAGRGHGRRLRAGQARPQAGRVSAPGDEGRAGRDPRRDGLPRAGDADPEPAGRHRAVQRLHAASRRSARRSCRRSPSSARSSSPARSPRGSTSARPKNCSA